MTLPSLMRATLIVLSIVANQHGLIRASSLPSADKWDAQANSTAFCSYVHHRTHWTSLPQLDFTVSMQGFGSRADRPGQGLLDNMRAPRRIPLNVEYWEAVFWRGSTASTATFTIMPTIGTVPAVQGAIWAASGGRVEIACKKR
ncbi:MAG: hypothetical protein M1832_000971 [Thelocarpon impressellum]|nr:MAG: hypothetical protein M1832_000971 [Thelocarpon impressellum]